MQRMVMIVIAGAFAAAAQQQPAQNADQARDVRLRQSNIGYDIELTRGADRSIVPVDYHFQSGDHLTLRVRVNKPAYVYVLNRTLLGAPDELKTSRQIRLVAEDGEPAAEAPEFTIVYPSSGHRLLKPGTVNLIPGSDKKLEMDENPGIEQLVMMVSPVPLTAKKIMSNARDVAELHANTRRIEFETLPPPPPPPVPPGPQKNQIQPPASNSTVCHAAPKVPSKPFLVDIVLAHYPSEHP